MSAHTPGPWYPAYAIGVGGTTPISDERNNQIASVDVLAWDDRYSSTANARLIAAAPDLLEALREIAEERGPNELTRDGIVTLARAAIAKATGVV